MIKVFAIHTSKKNTTSAKPNALRAMMLGVLALSFSAPSFSAEPAKYQASCGACHNMAVAGAPKTHDVAAWKPRLEKGMPALLKSVKEGLNIMPAGGNCADCTDAEYVELIQFMSSPAPTS